MTAQPLPWMRREQMRLFRTRFSVPPDEGAFHDVASQLSRPIVLNPVHDAVYVQTWMHLFEGVFDLKHASLRAYEYWKRDR